MCCIVRRTNCTAEGTESTIFHCVRKGMSELFLLFFFLILFIIKKNIKR